MESQYTQLYATEIEILFDNCQVFTKWSFLVLFSNFLILIKKCLNFMQLRIILLLEICQIQ